MKTLTSRLVLTLIFFASPLGADEQNLDTAAIDDFMPTIVALGEDTRQTFSARGATTHTDLDRYSYESSAVRGGQYCSQWLPANGWACYDALVDGEALIWVGESGNRTITTMKPKG